MRRRLLRRNSHRSGAMAQLSASGERFHTNTLHSHITYSPPSGDRSVNSSLAIALRLGDWRAGFLQNRCMAIPPIAPCPARVRTLRSRILGSTRLVILLVLFALLAAVPGLCVDHSRRDGESLVSQQPQSNRAGAGKKTIVDISPWQTAQALAPLGGYRRREASSRTTPNVLPTTMWIRHLRLRCARPRWRRSISP